jgi:hypothetical protein
MISSEPSLRDKFQENEPTDLCVGINPELVTVPSLGEVPEGTALNVVGSSNNKRINFRSIHCSQKGNIKKVTLIGNEVISKGET